MIQWSLQILFSKHFTIRCSFPKTGPKVLKNSVLLNENQLIAKYFQLWKNFKKSKSLMSNDSSLQILFSKHFTIRCSFPKTGPTVLKNSVLLNENQLIAKYFQLWKNFKKSKSLMSNDSIESTNLIF